MANNIGGMLDRFDIRCREADNILARYLLRAAVIINAEGDRDEAMVCFDSSIKRGRGLFKTYPIFFRAASRFMPGRLLNNIAHLPSNIREWMKRRRAARTAHNPDLNGMRGDSQSAGNDPQ